MTRETIIQRLLDKKEITAEEAVILLKPEIITNREVIREGIQTFPINPYPIYPTNPWDPQVFYTTSEGETIDCSNISLADNYKPSKSGN